MKHHNTIGVDLAKNVIQVSVLSGRGKELLNRSFTRRKFAEFLGKQKRSLVAFESCASAHYWARLAERHGHEPRIIPAKAVAPLFSGPSTSRSPGAPCERWTSWPRRSGRVAGVSHHRAPRRPVA